MKAIISSLCNFDYKGKLLCNIQTQACRLFCAKCTTNRQYLRHLPKNRLHGCQMRERFSNKTDALVSHSSFTHYHLTPIRGISIWNFSKQNEWNRALSEAEKIVGYPTSLMSLRCLLSDEIANVAVEMRKLVGTKHPLLKTARGLVTDGKFGMQTRGLMVLLLSKAAGPGIVSANTTQHQQTASEIATGIYASQRTLAEIVEMIHTATVIHKGVVNLGELTPADGPLKDMEFGNKMAVLSGDYLLASACTGLAELHNTKVVEVISSAIAEIMESEFTGMSNASNTKQMLNVRFDDWLHHTYLSSGSLLAKSCQAALELANHSAEMQKLAFEFGENMAYAYQLSQELKAFRVSDEQPLEASSLFSAPVIRHVDHWSDEQRQEVFAACTNSTLDIKQLLLTVSQSSSVDDCKEMCREYGENALDCLKILENSEAKSALRNIVNAVTMVR